MTDQKAQLYRKKEKQVVNAVQLDLDTEGFTFTKWGNTQRCQQGDWLVKSQDDCYTVARSTFAATYKEVSPGRYLKHGLVKAEKVQSAGKVSTREGKTNYVAGDYLIENAADPTDTYVMSAEKFNQLYESVQDSAKVEDSN